MSQHRALLTLLSPALLALGCAANPPPRATALEVAEACAGISDEHAASAVAALRRDVDSVRIARERTNTKPFLERTVGADVHVRATSGLTAQWLTRLLQCHALRDESGAACGSAPCPLAAGRIAIDVSPTGSGFFISIRSTDVDVAREIARRSQIVFAPQNLERETGVVPLTATLAP
ncbi:MAG: hypothetical protein ABW133_05210 [Polyangiaceae bacterium]